MDLSEGWVKGKTKREDECGCVGGGDEKEDDRERERIWICRRWR